MAARFSSLFSPLGPVSPANAVPAIAQTSSAGISCCSRGLRMAGVLSSGPAESPVPGRVPRELLSLLPASPVMSGFVQGRGRRLSARRLDLERDHATAQRDFLGRAEPRVHLVGERDPV